MQVFVGIQTHTPIWEPPLTTRNGPQYPVVPQVVGEGNKNSITVSSIVLQGPIDDRKRNRDPEPEYELREG